MSMILRAALAVAFSAALPGFLAAQVVRDCDRFEANARNLMMPPDVAVRSFANGDVRAIWLDTIEPACCSSHLMVTYWMPELSTEFCALVSGDGGLGFSGLDMSNLQAQYDPATGLTLSLLAGRYDGMGSVMSQLSVTINRATGTVKVTHD